MRTNLKPLSILSFQEIDVWDRESVLGKFLNAKVVRTNVSDILIVVEKNRRGGLDVSLLDRLASAINNTSKKKMDKDSAKTIANILNEQSKKLEAMSITYRIMASALMASKDNFIEATKNTDSYLKDSLENPFD